MKSPRRSSYDVIDNVMAAALPDAEPPPPAETKPEPSPVAEPEQSIPPEPPRTSVDGRSLRATGRTHQFATRIKEETHDHIKELAHYQRITIGELLERMTDVFWDARKLSKSREIKLDDTLKSLLSSSQKEN